MPLVTIPPQPFPPSSGKTGDIVERVTELETDVSGLETSVSNLQTTKANQTTIAPTFSAETAYNIGDLVFYNSFMYKCTTTHEGAWNSEHFTATTVENELDTLNTDVSNLQTTKANQITIAPTFSAETAYTVGDIVYYNGLTYKCTTNHTGAWDAGDFTATTIANELQNSGSGVVDYSTTEQTTGQKWIDGKDIYFKTIVPVEELTLNSQTWTSSGVSGADISTILNAFGCDNNGTFFNFFATPDVSSTGNIGFLQTRNTNITITKFVIFYTKNESEV